MKLAIIADIHHGSPHQTKRDDKTLEEMAHAAEGLRDAAPDLVLDLGDRIADMDHATDLRLEAEVDDVFSVFDRPVYHVCGNRDRYYLSVEENAEILGQSMASEVIDAGAWQIALWRAEANITWTETARGFDLPEQDYLWLARTLAGAEKPILVVSHVLVSGHSQIGNYYFQSNPDVSQYPQSARVRAARAQARVPVVCFV